MSPESKLNRVKQHLAMLNVLYVLCTCSLYYVYFKFFTLKHFVFIFPLDVPLYFIYVQHTELPLCMKRAI